MNYLAEIKNAYKYFQYQKEIHDPVCQTDWVATNHDGEILARAMTEGMAEMKAIARGHRHPIILSGYSYLRIFKDK